jgi:hypothetical protein
LVVDESVSLLKVFSNSSVDLSFCDHLEVHELSDKLALSTHEFSFSTVRVTEVVSVEVNSRSFSHKVNDYLNQPLLLKAITDVLVALHVA